jgi:hypothetical protein
MAKERIPKAKKQRGMRRRRLVSATQSAVVLITEILTLNDLKLHAKKIYINPAATHAPNIDHQIAVVLADPSPFIISYRL